MYAAKRKEMIAKAPMILKGIMKLPVRAAMAEAETAPKPKPK